MVAELIDYATTLAKHFRPDYVACCEDAMHFASLVNGHWYLYEKIPGGSRKYIGRIGENDVCPGKHREPCQVESSVTPMVATSLSAVVFEYGFSRAILELYPDSWKKLVGTRWKDVLIEIIVGRSPHSYLKKDRTDTQIRVHIGKHRRSLQKSIGISLDELWNMLGICVIILMNP